MRLQMEALYAKLYERYTRIKKERFTEFENISKLQDDKLLEIVTVLEERMSEELIKENQALTQYVDELEKRLEGVRADMDKQREEFLERLENEKEKNRLLSAEIRKLQDLEGGPSMFDSSKLPEGQQANSCQHSLHTSDEGSIGTPRRLPRIRARSPAVNSDHVSSSQDTLPNESPGRLPKKRVKFSSTTDAGTMSPSVLALMELSEGRARSADRPERPECCRSNIDAEGNGKCLYQGLLDCITHMKFSVVDQRGGNCIRAIHLSSGYSFRLTWVKNASGDGLWVYNVSTIGTLANVAPEWMKESIVFSSNMCPVFFERVSRVIKS